MILFANNASTSLANACSDSDSYIDVLPGMAELFPAPATEDDYFMITLVSPNDGSMEVMKVTSVYGDRFNVSRAQEGTIAMAFPQNTIVENRLTAGSLEQLLNDIAATTTEAGRLRLATLAEALAGVVQDAAVSPYTLNAVIETKVQAALDSINEQINTFKTTYQGVPGELKYFFEGGAPAGWAECNGQVIGSADVNAPGLFARLQEAGSAWKLTSEANWHALHNAVYAYNAHGGAYSWGNVGGVAKFVLDTNAKTIRLPDLRGMVMESAGFDGLGVSGVHGDGIRPSSIQASGSHRYAWPELGGATTGVFSLSGRGGEMLGNSNNNSEAYVNFNLNAPLITPHANKVQMRAFGMILCVNLGK